LPGSRTASKAKQDLPQCAEFFVDFLSRKSKSTLSRKRHKQKAKRNEHKKLSGHKKTDIQKMNVCF